MTMKTCKLCLEDKPIENFYKSPRNKDGVMTWCKACEKLRAQKRWIDNKDSMYARNEKWRKANPSKIAEYQRNLSADSKSKRHKRWASKNRQHLRDYANNRRAVMRNNGIYKILPKELKRLYNSSCVYCGSTERITADHVIPIVRGGAHSIGNLAPACLSCNSSKNKYFITEWRNR